MKLGVLINPVAGIGGPVALKGSDGAEIQAEARARGARPRAAERMGAALRACTPVHEALEFLTWGGDMGADLLASLGIDSRILGVPERPSTAADTRAAGAALAAAGVELLLFAGGDGTARDLLDAIDERIAVLGVPAGVKMHSGVFTVTPEDTGEIVVRLVEGGLVEARRGEVRDVDEAGLRQGRVTTRYYGELRVPGLGGFLQHTKRGGREDESLAVQEIAAEVVARLERLEQESRSPTVILGPGGTVQAIGRRLGHETTLLGFDALKGARLVARDMDSRALDRMVDPDTILVMSFGRGQGVLFGRGNQQLQPGALSRLTRNHLWIVATRTKLASLEGRPLRVDSGDPACDASWAGLVEIITGYEDACYYRIAAR